MSGYEPEPPIVCTLAGAEQQERRAGEFREVFTHLQRTELLDGGFRWFFRDEPGFEDCLRDLARREHDCCRFFDFRIMDEGGAIVWEVRGPKSAERVLAEFMRFPELLRDAPTIDIKRVISNTGLTFQADADENDPDRGHVAFGAVAGSG